MKLSPLLVLAIPLASAHTLQVRQSYPPTADEVGGILGQANPSNAADCLTLCSMAAFADSCVAEDAACMCNDEGWTNSLTSCVSRVCDQAIVGDIFDALKVACKRSQAPLKSDPTYDGGVSSPEESASALSSAISVASSVIVNTAWATLAAGEPTGATSLWSAPAETEAAQTTAPSSSTSAPAQATGVSSSAVGSTAPSGTAAAAAAAPTSGAAMVRVGGLGAVAALVGAVLVL
ncbi:hypothetical protein NCC49_003281 [Naganishia albida]|nr:hypothetical protein NCC49_003281 [Naganishia albida]